MEALGRVTLEAMLAVNMVIGTYTGGTLELIGENQERGYLYKQGNYRDLAKVMKELMSFEPVTDNEKYDYNVKTLLANKSSLAWILKYTTDEFKIHGLMPEYCV